MEVEEKLTHLRGHESGKNLGLEGPICCQDFDSLRNVRPDKAFQFLREEVLEHIPYTR